MARNGALRTSYEAHAEHNVGLPAEKWQQELGVVLGWIFETGILDDAELTAGCEQGDS
jgi:hypothetical protein